MMPATCIISSSKHQHALDRLIYTDPQTNKLVVKRKLLTIFHVRKFMDEHMKPKPQE